MNFETANTVQITKIKKNEVEEKRDTKTQQQQKKKNRNLNSFLNDLKLKYKAQLK